LESLVARAASYSPSPPKPPAAQQPKAMSTSKKAKSKKRGQLAASAHEIHSQTEAQVGYFSSTQLSQKSAAFAKAASAKARDAIMVRMRKHLEEARAHFQLGGGAIFIDAAAIGASERASTAKNHSAAVKDKGVSTARRSAIIFVCTVIPGLLFQYDKGGFDLWGRFRGVVADVSRMPLTPKGSKRNFFCCKGHLL
jgi:type IV secretory pathway VirB10-like protein